VRGEMVVAMVSAISLAGPVTAAGVDTLTRPVRHMARCMLDVLRHTSTVYDIGVDVSDTQNPVFTYRSSAPGEPLYSIIHPGEPAEPHAIHTRVYVEGGRTSLGTSDAPAPILKRWRTRCGTTALIVLE